MPPSISICPQWICQANKEEGISICLQTEGKHIDMLQELKPGLKLNGISISPEGKGNEEEKKEKKSKGKGKNKIKGDGIRSL